MCRSPSQGLSSTGRVRSVNFEVDHRLQTVAADSPPSIVGNTVQSSAGSFQGIDFGCNEVQRHKARMESAPQ